MKKCGVLCLWCCLFFLVIPFSIYFAAFLPNCTLPHNAGRIWETFWSYQTTMFNYHSGLQATHYFASPWYEWPLDIRPIWYFSSDVCNGRLEYSTITAMGNPLLWWSCLPGMVLSGILWFQKRRRAAGVALAGFLSVYLPWVLVSRLTFIYHYFTAVPFLILGLMLLWQTVMEGPHLGKKVSLSLPGGEGETISFPWGGVLLGAFTALTLLLFCVYFPVISGVPTTQAYAEALRLLPTWYF